MEYLPKHCKNDGTSNAHCNRNYLRSLWTYVHIIIIKKLNLVVELFYYHIYAPRKYIENRIAIYIEI